MKLNMSGSAAKIGANSNDLGMVEWSDNARVFRSPSGSRQGKFHFTVVSKDGYQAMCTCEGFQFRGKCKHLACVEQLMLNEQPIQAPDMVIEITSVSTASPLPVVLCKEEDPVDVFKDLPK